MREVDLRVISDADCGDLSYGSGFFPCPHGLRRIPAGRRQGQPAAGTVAARSSCSRAGDGFAGLIGVTSFGTAAQRRRSGASTAPRGPDTPDDADSVSATIPLATANRPPPRPIESRRDHDLEEAGEEGRKRKATDHLDATEA